MNHCVESIMMEQGTTSAQGLLKCVRAEGGNKKNPPKPSSTYYLHVPSHDTGCLDATKQYFLVEIVSAMLLYIPKTRYDKIRDYVFKSKRWKQGLEQLRYLSRDL